MVQDRMLEPVSDEVIAAIVAQAKRQNAEYDALRARRLVEAKREAERLAILLSRREGVRRVILFGSAAASGKFFRPDSDIDLAIEGGDVLSARAFVEDSSFRVDLVGLNEVHSSIRNRIVAEGVSLYEA